MNAIAIELRLLPQQYEQLTAIASARRLSVAEAAQAAIKEWLEHQARLERARVLLRELGRGLGQGPASNEVARNHDAHLYTAPSRA